MGLFDKFKKKKKEELPTVIDTPSEIPVVESDVDLSVVLETLPSISSIDKDKLIEITDPSVLARLDALVPAIGTSGVSIGNVVKKSTETLYRVVLKNGGQLVNSREMAGAKRAIAMGANGIAEHANLIAAKPDAVGEIANVGAGVFSVASMIVGQYYMQQIDSKIAVLADCVSSIAETLEIEYKSKVASLIESVYAISKFQIASISNEEMRKQEITNLQNLKRDCQELLNQAEGNIESVLGKRHSKYDDYKKAMVQVEKWRRYQELLVQVLYQIDTLEFVLNLGVRAQEQCFCGFSLHEKKLETIHTAIVSWHTAECELLKIDVEEAKRKNTGLLGLLEKPIGLINREWNYRQLDAETVGLIKQQTTDTDKAKFECANPFQEEVEIIVMDGKKYYLPHSN